MLQCYFYTHTYTRKLTHTHKGVRKFKGLRLILMNSQIFIFLYIHDYVLLKKFSPFLLDMVSIVAKTTKFE